MGKVVTLGEIMMRLSTNPGKRLSHAQQFEVCYGGGEANVAISLANYGHEVSFASKVPNNDLGQSVKKFLNGYGVSTSQLLFGGQRLGLYYMEAGVGKRSANVIYDRVGSSFGDMKKIEWNINTLFEDVDLFHISGITSALSKEWKNLTIDLIKMAKKAGVKISFDINYRSKMWSLEEARETIKLILPYVDYCSAGDMDARYILNISKYSGDIDDKNEMVYYYQEMQRLFPNIEVFYSTKRITHSATENDLTGNIWMGKHYYESNCHNINPIVDRIGGGDAFSGGVLHGLLCQYDPQMIIKFATAASALKHTVYGDCNQFSVSEVNDFLETGIGKINR
ncbi:2-dehydro-3-deoxygluconokinase [Carnobacterium sp. 17-4]|uniref:sugar kinase n=1 Tax=Carnobacterium sp. (strain 17-4) TaxID=208596 RepID=UPI0002058CF1|nr:sugar kinase [Carnobacterium sp. 17-4]AEB30156.1 2-dehydro-3-deoxygluconokinase [Carnobacterium sp. 17-4]